MSKRNLPDIITAIIIEETTPVYFDELCHTLHTEDTFITALIEYEILTPSGQSTKDWHFDSNNLKRAKTAVSFHQDLGVNLNGIALAFQLLDEMH